MKFLPLLAVLAAAVPLVSCKSVVADLPPAWYARPGLERMPRLAWSQMRVVNVRDLGADPTGAKEVNDAFNRGLAALRAQGGGVLYVPPGRYRFAMPQCTPEARYSWRVEKAENLHIVGAGPEATVICVDWDAVRQDGDPVPYLWSFSGCNNLSIRDLSFSSFPVFSMRSPRAMEGPQNLAFGGNTGVQVLNVTADQGRMGICFWGGNRDVWVVGCDVRNTAADAIKFDSCVDVVAAYNYLENNNDDGFSALHMEGGLSARNAFLYNTLLYNHGWGRGIAISGRDHRIVGNWVEAQAMPGLLFHPLGFKSSKPADAINAGHVAADNTFVRCDLHAAPANRLLGHRYGGGIAIGYPFQDLAVTGNRSLGNASDGFGAVDSGSTQVDGFTLTGNEFQGNLGYGIGLRALKPGAFIRRADLGNNLVAGNLAGSLLALGKLSDWQAAGTRLDVPARVGSSSDAIQSVLPPGASQAAPPVPWRDIYRVPRTAADEADWRPAPAVAVAGPELNVRAFGAQGNGRDDDTAAFARALAALPATGGVLRIPAGSYRLDPLPGQDRLSDTCVRHHLLLADRSNVHLIGDGEASLLSFGSFAHEGLRLIGLKDSSVRRLALEVRPQSPHRKSRAPLDAVACEGLVLEQVVSRRSAGQGLRLDACTGVLLDACRIEDAGQSGINLLGCRQVTVRGCRILNSRDYGINIGSIGGIARQPQCLAIEDCEIAGVREGHGISIPYGDRIAVRRNRISGAYQAGVALYYSNAIFPTERVEIADNDIGGCVTGPLAYLRGAVSLFYVTSAKRRTAGAADVVVSGNRIHDTPLHGVWVEQCEGMARLAVRGNQFANVGGEKIAIGDAQRAAIKTLELEP